MKAALSLPWSNEQLKGKSNGSNPEAAVLQSCQLFVAAIASGKQCEPFRELIVGENSSGRSCLIATEIASTTALPRPVPCRGLFP